VWKELYWHNRKELYWHTQKEPPTVHVSDFRLSINWEFPSVRILVLRSSTNIIPDPHTAFRNCDRDLQLAHPQLLLVGFADDTNLIAIGETFEANKSLLENAWETCTGWAKKRGMVFAPEKSELLHFSRAHAERTLPLRLGDLVVRPTKEARFLGVWLNNKLSWKAYIEKVKAKIKI
jgi:hypothetical protein